LKKRALRKGVKRRKGKYLRALYAWKSGIGWEKGGVEGRGA